MLKEAWQGLVKDDEEIMTHDNPMVPTRAGKVCKCYECGIIRRCVPSFDFYTKETDANKKLAPLYCEGCLLTT
jgi:hypothetical protein